MKKIIFLALSATSLACFAAPDISGNYTCKGHDPFLNEDFQGLLVVKKTGETYQFNWDFGKKEQYTGTGFFTEGVDNYIPVTIAPLKKINNSHNPYNAELQMYQIQHDGTLSGRWTYLGKDKVGPLEVCTKKA